MTIHPNHIDRGDEDNNRRYLSVINPACATKSAKVPLDAIGWRRSISSRTIRTARYAVYVYSTQSGIHFARDIGDEAELNGQTVV